MPGNVYIGGILTATVLNAYHSNVSDVANLVAGANVSGTVSNAVYADSAGAAVTAITAEIAGTVTANAQPNINSVGILTSLSVSGITTIQEAIEKFTPNAIAASGTINYNLLTQAIIYNTTNATSNFTLNFRGNSSVSLNTMLSINQSITCTFINTNGNSPYYANVIQVDGVVISPSWVFAPAGIANGKDVYTFNILKTAANTYMALGSVVGYT